MNHTFPFSLSYESALKFNQSKIRGLSFNKTVNEKNVVFAFDKIKITYWENNEIQIQKKYVPVELESSHNIFMKNWGSIFSVGADFNGLGLRIVIKLKENTFKRVEKHNTNSYYIHNCAFVCPNPMELLKYLAVYTPLNGSVNSTSLYVQFSRSKKFIIDHLDPQYSNSIMPIFEKLNSEFKLNVLEKEPTIRRIHISLYKFNEGDSLLELSNIHENHQLTYKKFTNKPKYLI